MKRKETPKTKARKKNVKKKVEKPAAKSTAKKAAAVLKKKVAATKPKVVAKKPKLKKDGVKKAAPAKSKAAPKIKKTVKTKVKVVRKAATKKKAAPEKIGTAVKAKTPSKTRRPKSFGQSLVVRGHGFPADAPELPEKYLRDRLVLMTQEPDTLFSYWEITPARLIVKEGEKRKGEEYREVLKLNWAARSLFDENFVLIPVSLAARRWYLRVPFPGVSYQVEIGWLGSSGHFVSILESNESESPESWDETLRRLREAGEILKYSTRIAKPLGASERPPVEKKGPVPLNWNPDMLSSSSLQAGLKKKNKPAPL